VPHSPIETPLRHHLGLALAVLVCYANALLGDFQFDDYKVIVDNTDVHSWSAWLGTDGQGWRGIRPLLKISYVLNWTWGTGAVGFHGVNIAIHLVTTWLVYRLTQEFLSALPNRSEWASVPLWAALLFAVHPANTEAVTYISGRSAALMALFYLAALAVYADACRARHRLRFEVAVPVLFLLALAVKETAVTLPLALLVWEFALGTPARQIWQRQRNSWLLLLAGAVFYLLNDSYLAHMQRSAELNSLAGNVATQALGFGYLMRQWALPFWLNIDPDLPVLPGLDGAGVYVAWLITTLFCALWARRRRPWVCLALCWALVHLVTLYIFLPRLDVANDRQLYLAAWPLGMALVCELRLRLRPQVCRAGLGLMLLTLGCLSITRNQDYRSEIALWQATAKLSPNKARVHNNLGYAYKLAGRTSEARVEYREALRLDPTHIKARYNLKRLDLPD